jgi:medium-chain acyl-[acyl-carrier-protein] hydrolase
MDMGRFLQLPVGEDRAVPLLCFPHAGGDANAYRAWRRDLGASANLLPVLLPGRGSRMAEPLMSDPQEIVSLVADEAMELSGAPYAIFGHSMGALLAYGLAGEMARRGAPPPCLLFVSGRGAPHRQGPIEPFANLPTPQFRAHLAALGGTPREVLENEELMALMEPILRVDLSMVERFPYAAAKPVPCPVLALAGRSDPRSPLDQVAAWRDLSNGDFAMEIFDGDHFFVQSRQAAVTRTIGEALAARMVAEPRR